MPNFTQWLMGTISAVLICIGLALCFTFTGGIGLIVGSALLAGGTSGFMAAYQGVSWGDFWKSVVSGAIAGAITGLASPFVANVATNFASMVGNQLSKYLIHMAISVVGHMGISFVSNGLQNLIRGQPFTRNWQQALLSGAVIGAVSSAVYIIQDYGIDRIVQRIETFIEEYGTHPLVSQFTNQIRDYIPNYISSINNEFLRQGAQFAWDTLQTMTTPQIAMFINNNIHYLSEFIVGAATQYLMHGRVNFLLAAGQAIAYGAANWSLASRNLPRQLMRQAPTASVVYSTVNITDTPINNVRAGEDEPVQRPPPTSEVPEAHIPATGEPLSAQTATTEPPSYEEATRNDASVLPTAEPRLPAEVPSLPSSIIPENSFSTAVVSQRIPEPPSAVIATPHLIETEHSAPTFVDTVSLQQPITDVPLANQNEQVSSTPTPTINAENAERIVPLEPLPTSSTTVTNSINIETNDSNKVEESAAVLVTDSKNEKKGGENAKIAVEYLTFNKGLVDGKDDVQVHQINVNDQNIEILTRNSNELVSDEEFEVLISNENFTVDTIDGNAIENIETELFKVDKILQEHEQNQIKESCRNSRIEIWQNNTEDYAQKIRTNNQNYKKHESTSKQKKSVYEALKNTKNNIVSNIPDICKPTTWTSTNFGRQKKSVFVCPFVIFNESEAKYQLLDPKEWPIFPKEGVRVVTVSGAHSSGRTTFIHSLAYTLGYSLTEEQAMTSRFSTGIIMYLFPEDNLLVFDCADSLTRIDDNLAPSALTLELFCYLISDHRIHHVAMGDDPHPYINHCEKTMKMLFKSGAFVDLQGGRMATLLLRYSDKMSPEKVMNFNRIRKDYQQQTEDKAKSYINHINIINDPTNFQGLDGEKMTALKDEKKDELVKLYEERSFDLKMEKLLLLPKPYSEMEQQLYHSEIRHIADMILKTTPIHHTFVEFEQEGISPELKEQKPSFAELVLAVWYAVADNKELFETTTNAMNKHTVSQNGDKFDVEKYLNDVLKLFGNVKGVTDAFEWIKKAAEENAKNSEKDAMFIFRGIARVAEAVIKERKNGNVAYFDSCVQCSLSGLLLFFGQQEKNFEFLSVKSVIEDTKILDELIDDAIIYNYANVWAYFHHLANYLYRLELINIDLVDKAIKVLKAKKDGIEDQKIKANIYATFSMLIYADVNCILGQKAPATENKKLLDEEDFIEIHYKFEKAADKFLIQFKEGREYKNRKEFHEAYGKMMEFPKTYYNGTDYAKLRNISFEELDPPIKYRFECTMLKHFYNAIGYFVSKRVIENCANFMPAALETIVPLPDYIINMQKQALNLWACIGNLSVTFENLLRKILLDTNFKEWLLTYRLNLEQANLVPVLQLCNVVAYAESIYDYIPHPEFDVKIGTNQDFHDLQLLNQQKQLAEHYRHIVFDILEKTKISKAIKVFCNKTFTDSSMLEEAETWIAHFERIIKQGLENDDKNKCLFAFLDRRFEIIKKLRTVAVLAELTLKNEDNFSSPDTVTKALKLLFSISQFLNKIIVLHKVEENDDFFNPGKKINSNGNILPADSEIWEDLTKIFGILAFAIIKNGRYLLEKSNLDSNIYEHGVLYILWYIYNLSSISKISYSSVLTLLPTNISFDYIKAQSEEKLIYKIEDYCCIEIRNNEKKDIQVIQTAAYIWAKFSTISTETLKETFHEECGYLINAFEESVKLWRCSEIRNKKIEDFKKRLISSAENCEILNRFAEQLLIQPSQSYQIDDTMKFMKIANGQKAIKDIIFSAHGHERFEGWKFAAPNYEQKLFNALIANVGKIKAIALMFMLGNDDVKNVKFVVEHFQKLWDKEDSRMLKLRTKTNGRLNAKVAKLFKLNFIFDVFIEFGYEKSESEEEGIKLEATADSIEAAKNEIKKFLEFCNGLKIGNLTFKSVFVEVEELTSNESDQIGIFEYLELPDTFIKYACQNIPSLSVKYLRENFVRNNLQLQYALVRIRLENGKTIQAVFFAAAFLESVLVSLAQYLGEEKERIQLLNMQNIRLSLNQSLESLGLVPGGYLKAAVF